MRLRKYDARKIGVSIIGGITSGTAAGIAVAREGVFRMRIEP